MFASAHAGLARVLCMGAIYYRTAPVDEAGQLAEALARRAVQLDNDDPDAHAALAQALVLREEMDGAWASAEMAREINPNSARAQLYLGLIHIRQGRPAEGRAALELALRLSPREPGNRSVRQLICLSYFQEHDYQGCVAAARQAVIMENANAATVARLLAASLGQLGRIAEAATALRDTMTMTPELFDDFVRHRPPWYRPEDYEHLLDGLRKAGWQG